MKSRIHTIFLSLFFVLALCFSFSIQSDAHPYKDYTHDSALDIHATDITDGNAAANEDDIEKLLLHVVEHYKLIEQDNTLEDLQDTARELSILSRKTRETGTFNNGSDTYPVRVTTRDRKTIITHGKYANLYGLEYDTAQAPLDELLAADVAGEPVCQTYNNGSKVACAMKQVTIGEPVTFMVGFDHEEESDYTKDPDCSRLAMQMTTTAKQVEEETDVSKQKQLLKEYVQSFRDLMLAEARIVLTDLATQQVAAPADPAKMFFESLDPNNPVLTRLGRQKLVLGLVEGTAACVVGDEAFKYGSIYIFVMDPVEGISLLNGLDPGLQGLSVSLEDPLFEMIEGNTEKNVLKLFQKALTNGNTGTVPDDLADGNNAFVKYHWDDPRIAGIEVPDFLEQDPPVVPGTTIKESYLEVEAAASGTEGIFYVIGSGIYLDDEMPMPPGGGTMAAADDDGCSIAAAGSTHESTLLNLLLTASVLFSAVFWRRRG